MARKKKEPNHVDDLLDERLEDCVTPEDILGKSGLMSQIKKRLVECALAGEFDAHLNSENADASRPSNSRNGRLKKTVRSTDGELALSIPRDCQGSFEPILVPKHQRRIVGLDEKILALYAKDNSTRGISNQLEELYGGAKISASVISEVIDSVSADIKAWQSCPLDEVYPIVYIDALHVNIKLSGRVSKRRSMSSLASTETVTNSYSVCG